MPATRESRSRSKLTKQLRKVDELLTSMHYFRAETLCLETIDKACHYHFFDIVAHAAMPLLEAHRQKRVAALEAGELFFINEDLPHPEEIKPGVYLIAPPRVGMDGKRLRDAAHKNNVPVITLVREPTTKTGLVPVVAIARKTFRAKVEPYDQPTIDWVLGAIEALGESALELMPSNYVVHQQVDYLVQCIHTHPDYEKFYLLLADLAREAVREWDEIKAKGGSNYDDPFAEEDDFLEEDQVSIDFD